jgi:hypothetical protein
VAAKSMAKGEIMRKQNGVMAKASWRQSAIEKQLKNNESENRKAW